MPQTTVTTTSAAAFPGMLGDGSLVKDAMSFLNGEASAEIPFGYAVVQGSADNEAVLPAAGTDAEYDIVRSDSAPPTSSVCALPRATVVFRLAVVSSISLAEVCAPAAPRRLPGSQP